MYSCDFLICVVCTEIVVYIIFAVKGEASAQPQLLRIRPGLYIERAIHYPLTRILSGSYTMSIRFLFVLTGRLMREDLYSKSI